MSLEERCSEGLYSGDVRECREVMVREWPQFLEERVKRNQGTIRTKQDPRFRLFVQPVLTPLKLNSIYRSKHSNALTRWQSEIPRYLYRFWTLRSLYNRTSLLEWEKLRLQFKKASWACNLEMNSQIIHWKTDILGIEMAQEDAWRSWYPKCLGDLTGWWPRFLWLMSTTDQQLVVSSETRSEQSRAGGNVNGRVTNPTWHWKHHQTAKHSTFHHTVLPHARSQLTITATLWGGQGHSHLADEKGKKTGLTFSLSKWYLCGQMGLCCTS